MLLRYESAWQVKQQALRDRVESVRGILYADLPEMSYVCAMRHLGDALPDADAVEQAWRSSVEGMVPAKNVGDPFSRERRLNQARDVLVSMLGSPEHREAMQLAVERQEAARLAKLEVERRENARKEQERLDADRIEAERASERKKKGGESRKTKRSEPTYKATAMKILGLSGDVLDVKAVEKAWEFQVENTKTPRKSLDPYAKTRQLHKAKDVLLGSLGSEAQQKAAEQLATELLMSEPSSKKRRKIGTVKINMRITEFAGTVEEFNERRLFLAQWANSVCALFENQRCHMDVSMKVH